MELAKEGKSAILFVVRLGLLGTVALIAALVSGGRSDVAQAATVTVEVGDFWFCDSSFQGGVCETTIDVGDTVTWQWVGFAPHTSTEWGDSLGTCPAPPLGEELWDSGTKSSGTFDFTFDSTGTFLYRCQIHPSTMRGRIVVEVATELDSDGDGFADTVELFVGTDPGIGCGPGAWPPDFNDDERVSITDVLELKASFGSVQGDVNYQARHDLNADGRISIADVLILKPIFGSSCSA